MNRLKIIIISILLLLSFPILPNTVTYAKFYYEIPEQKEILQVNTDGTVILEKEFSFYVLPSSTENGTEVWVGLPTDDTRVLDASFTMNGKQTVPEYQLEKDNDEQYVSFNQFPAIRPGEIGTFSFVAQIPDLVYWLDKKQPGKDFQDQLVSISYIPAWWEKGNVGSLVVEMHFDDSLTPEALRFGKTLPSRIKPLGDSTQLVWEYTNVPNNKKLHHAVILPRYYFARDFTPLHNWISTLGMVIIILFVGGLLVGLVILTLYAVKNRRYQTPVAYMKGDKAYTTFDPVEAAIFFNLSTDFISKMIIMGLIDKRIVQINNEKLKKVPSLEQLTWYEELFLESVDQDVQIIPEKWKETYPKMISHFYDMIKGYCGRQTTSYYTNLLKKEDFSNNDPRWVILQSQLARGTFENPEEKERMREYTPYYIHSYLPLFYLTVINSSLQKENRKQYTHIFPGASGSGGGSGSGCACACACACASSGGCT